MFIWCDAVTAVDSGIKALEYLGLVDDENTRPDTDPFPTSAKNHHVLKYTYFFFKFLSISDLI